MKKKYTFIGFVLLGVAATTITGVLYQLSKRNSMKRLLNAANEGYETAHDIIYPKESGNNFKKKLRYGPIF